MLVLQYTQAPPPYLSGAAYAIDRLVTVVFISSFSLSRHSLTQARQLPASADPTGGLLWGSYLHSCVLCDGALYSNAAVVVVGGGDAAIDGALQLLRIASKVTVIHRRNEFRSTNVGGIEHLRAHPRATVLTSYTVDEWVIEGLDRASTAKQRDTSGKLVAVRLCPSSVTCSNKAETITVMCSGGFVMIGAVTDF